ncbi:A disintegrin and metalloproteinase with thrombospondin motifs 18-like isoform X2 [Ruditapes philippinarum]|uniref:A disintegrin and metalloproteinase with thrombospondin motifs 18-like isoform X2 n=1 Tax=Ruditapes philippinarum TaxID=129788 RepID=UPI00295BD78C|nr:A disintegrin and metalloproteinase with thrombospondin motifs 18-like isoform X2 [Ruditapes philippinarum]
MTWFAVKTLENSLLARKWIFMLVVITVFTLTSASGQNHHHSNQGHHHSNQGHHHNNHSHSNHKNNDENHEKSSDSAGISEEPYTIVYPQIIDNKAGIMVNNVKNYVRRRKRTLGGENKPLEISISGGKEMFDLELWENDKLLAPGFKIYRRTTLKNSQSDKEVRQEDVYGCHFTGHVKAKSNNQASLSICNGLNGMIRTERDDFLIEPVNLSTMHGSSDFIGQPHKLYKRSILDSKHQKYYEAQKTGQRDIIVERGVDDDSDEIETEEQNKILVDDEQSLDKSLHSVEKRAAFKYKFLREMSSPKTVEMLVVVDKNMYHKHGDANITTYTLTLFNMLSQLFKDGSLGNKIDVVLVGLILLEGDERGLTIDYNADDTLNSFCQWQSVLVGANGRQHDHAILLTGLDLCSYKNSPCDTLGFAPMEGMCNRVRSCTVNEDTGLSTAFTIAHEVGHNFGMFHDGEGNYCTESAGKIMSPTLMGKDGQFHWSVCSKAYLMRFLNTPQSDCLDDEPKQVAELKFPNKLPGELYNADIQCKWQFGSRARLCTYDFGKDICKALWCYRGNKRCETKFLPAAEGTSCGTGKWCRQGKCVDYGNEGPKPIDGGWSSWSEWSECSRTCGGGVITRERECSRPLPQYGGKACLGEDKVFKMCNVIDCPVDADDFHTAQCATYNKQPFQGWYLQWKPQKLYNNENEPCKLHCIADTPDYVFTIKHTATDGMECGIDKKKICVQGECQPVGCDWVVGSTLHDDMCGVCDGDNSTCRLIRGEYLEQPKLNTYFPVTILPKLARSIRIREKSLSSNYLAVRNVFGKYYLNGHQRVAWPGTYTLGGAKFKYNRSYNVPETLEAEGPLEQELVLEILVQDNNPGIEYEYTLPKLASEIVSTPTPDNYTWSLSVESCSELCAGGMKSVTAICHRNFEEEVESSFCEGLEKPKTGMFPCNEQPCEPRWVTEDWRPCTKMCGGGKQKRRVRCRQKLSRTKDKKLKRKMCKHLQKPVTRQRCNEQECPPDWHAADWTKCSVSCGLGTQVRKVTCRSAKGRKILPESMCHTNAPITTQTCEVRPCNGLEKSARKLETSCSGEDCGTRWVVSDWSVCSRDCAGGIQKRRVWCENKNNAQVKNKMCKHLEKPDRRQACNEQDCPPSWHSGKWNECSTSCGSGVQLRRITCRTKDTNGHKVLQDDQCITKKPDHSRSCYLGPCDSMMEEFDWLLSPWGPCSKSCGVGSQSRIVSCVNNRGQPSTFCSESSRPVSTQSCNYGECVPTPLGQHWCKDQFSWCHLVPHHKVCNKQSYKEKCCKSCLTGR